MLSGMVWTYILVLHGVFCAVRPVSVNEGDSVTLPNDFKITNEYKIRWYFNDTRIADIDLSDGKSCTDVQCNKDTEGFTDRLKLDHQTGNLTIMNIRITDSGQYKLEVMRTGDDKEESYNVTVLSVSAADRHEMEQNTDGESDTSDTGSGLSSGAVAGICIVAFVVLLGIGAGVIYSKLKQKRNIQIEERAPGNPEEVPLRESQENAKPQEAANENP